MAGRPHRPNQRVAERPPLHLGEQRGEGVEQGQPDERHAAGRAQHHRHRVRRFPGSGCPPVSPHPRILGDDAITCEQPLTAGTARDLTRTAPGSHRPCTCRYASCARRAQRVRTHGLKPLIRGRGRVVEPDRSCNSSPKRVRRPTAPEHTCACTSKSSASRTVHAGTPHHAAVVVPSGTGWRRPAARRGYSLIAPGRGEAVEEWRPGHRGGGRRRVRREDRGGAWGQGGSWWPTTATKEPARRCRFRSDATGTRRLPRACTAPGPRPEPCTGVGRRAGTFALGVDDHRVRRTADCMVVSR